METRAASGLILGKFLPPHAGHLYLIAAAQARVERLTVVVGSLAREPIPGARRVEWLRELCPGVEVVALTDALPQYPHEHPEFWELWTAALRRVIPRAPDVVFSSEEYGDELARRLGARHAMIDLAREQVPISGSAIRADPMRHWEFIPAVVRPWFVRRVLITGAESTGKTTLARDLAARFATTWVPEYAREVLDAKAQSFDGPAEIVELADFAAIAKGQGAREDLAARAANRVLFCDTDAAVTAIYAQRYCHAVPPEVSAEVAARRYDFAILTGLDVAWEKDRHRDSAHLRESLHAQMRRSLETRKIPFVELAGPPEARLAAAAQAIESRLQSRS